MACRKDSLILTNRGLLRMDEIGNVYGNQDIQPMLNISTIEGNKIEKFYMNGETCTSIINTKDGLIVEYGLNHELSIIIDMKKEWCSVRDLVVGDKIIIQIGGFLDFDHYTTTLKSFHENYSSEEFSHEKELTYKEDFPELELTSELAYFMGVLSCSCKCVNGQININCTSKTGAIVSDILLNVFNIFDISNFNNQVSFYSIWFERWMIANDLCGKHVSIMIRTTSRHMIQSFMQGMEQTHPSCYNLLSPNFIQEILALYRFIGYNMMYDKKTGVFKVKHNIEMFQEDEKIYILDRIENIERSSDYMFDIKTDGNYYVSGNICRTSTVEIVIPVPNYTHFVQTNII